MSAALRDRLLIEPSPTAVAERAALLVIDAARRAIDARGEFTIALTGGSSPLELYELLTREPYRGQLDWGRAVVLFGDERAVPPDHPQSNYGKAHEVLLAKVPVSDERVYRMEGERVDLEAAAAEYEADVRKATRTPAGEVPAIDLILLGIGADGHIFSLHPGNAEITDPSGVIAAVRDPPMNPPWSRITMTPLVLDAARGVLVLAFGSGKAAALRAVLDGPRDPSKVPGQLVARAGERVTIIADRAAAEDASAG